MSLEKKKSLLSDRNRRNILERCLKGRLKKTQAAQKLGVSRKTLYEWLDQLKQSRDLPAQQIANVTLDNEILKIASSVPEMGPKKIATKLRQHNLSVSTKSVWLALKKKGLSKRHQREIYGLKFRKGSQSQDLQYPRVLRYSPELRKRMVEEVFLGQKKPGTVCAEYNVSRKTYNKWRRRYLNASEDNKDLLNSLSDKCLDRLNHPRAYNSTTEESVLKAVAANPSFSSHKLSKILGLGNHGIYNVLKRHELNRVQDRIAYASKAEHVVQPVVPTYTFKTALKNIWQGLTMSLMPAPPPFEIKAFAASFVISLIVFTGIFKASSFIAQAPSVAVGIGYFFAITALSAGMFFFLYSLKYYLTLAIVLSASEDQRSEINESSDAGFFQSLLVGSKNIFSRPNSLSANIDSIKLKEHPFISVHVALYNEKNVVERLVQALTTFDYGNYEIILADDSTDETVTKITEFQKRFLFKGEQLKVSSGDGWSLSQVEVKPGIILKHLHRTTRDGFKGAALTLALKHTNPQAKYISIFDADFVPYPDTLEMFLKYFQINSDPKTAAVQGYQWHVLNKSENWITRGVRSEYAGSYVIERAGNEIYGGLKQISGSVYMIKKAVLEEIGWGRSITEDFELTLKLYNAGYKVAYTPYIQATAECVSTLPRLIKQRMRWAEGHSFNVKTMFSRLMSNPKVTSVEKMEFLYLSPYYLQAMFFMIGTFAWLMSEAVFRVRLPFWTELWGWSLVLTNMISLPLLNAVGLFLEESDKKDYSGLMSFVMLSYILVPFQAYAALKGFLEKDEGGWFRTPKSGHITDKIARGKFVRFIEGILPKYPVSTDMAQQYLSINTANSRFDNFRFKPSNSRVLGYFGVILTVTSSIFLIYKSQFVESKNLASYPVWTETYSETASAFDIKDIFSAFMPGRVLSKEIGDVFAGRVGHDSILIYSGIASMLMILLACAFILRFVKKHKKLIKVVAAYLIILSIVMSDMVSLLKLRPDSQLEKSVVPQEAKATFRYSSTGGQLVTGSETSVDSQNSGQTEGRNVGDWKGTLFDDNLGWVVTGANAASADNYNVQLSFDGINLNGANTLIFQNSFDIDASISLKIQICDWVSTTSVDNATDSQCTGGGWRTLNTQDASNADVNFTTTGGDTSVQWHIYNGYFTTGTTGGTAVSTPLSNFVTNDSNKRLRIRYYSTVQSSTDLFIEFARVMAMINPSYYPASFTQITGGTPTGTYVNAHPIGNSTTGQASTSGGDSVRVGVPGTVSAISDFYLSYNNVETYTGANAIYIRADYICSSSGLNVMPKIYNFNSSAWEDLSASAFACPTSDTTNAWAKGNITLSNYISSGEIRVGWYGDATNTTSISLDFMHVMIGSVNSDSSQCEVSYGTGTATDCADTRTLDGTTAPGTGDVFQNPAEDESTTVGHSLYAFDTDQDNTTEEAAASNISVGITIPSQAQVVGINYAARMSGCNATGLSAACGATALTVTPQIRDYGGTAGSWISFSSNSFGNITLGSSSGYIDSVSGLSATAPMSVMNNPVNYLDTTNNLANVRLKTNGGGTSSANVTVNWDFNMVSIAWINEAAPIHPAERYIFTPTSQNLVTGTDQAVDSVSASTGTGRNMGDWRGTIGNDFFHWTVAGANVVGTNYDVQLNIDNVQLNGANKMLVQSTQDTDAAIALLFQICDWVSTTSVDNAADSQCTGGGWRTINTQDASNNDIGLTTVTSGTSLQWHIYNGYFTTGTTGGSAIDTPLTNFISNDSNRRVKIRYFSTTQSSTNIDIDFLSVAPIIDSTYHAAGFTQVTGGTPTGTYVNTGIVGNTTSTQQTTTSGDSVKLQVPGTAGAISDFYLSYKNVKTYTGANTIYVKADYGCSSSGMDIMPKIYNFNSSAWEDLSASVISCATGDTTNAWAKSNVTVSNYISSGEIRVGWYGSATSTRTINLDHQYVILGTTNTDSAACEVSYGTGTATDCADTRTLDGTTTPAAGDVFQNAAEDESTNVGHSLYSLDVDHDGTQEEATASNIDFSVTLPANSHPVGVNFATRASGCGASSLSASCGATALTITPGIRYKSGLSGTSNGSWTAIGTTMGNVTLGSGTGYGDTITTLSFTSPIGMYTVAEDYVDVINNKINMNFKTSAGGTLASNVTTNVDFAMVSPAWINPDPKYDLTDYRFFANLDQSPPDVSTALANQNTAATAPTQGTPFRLRMLINNYGQDLATSGQNFKVQIATRGADNLCDTSFTNETYSDLSPSSGAVRYYDNSTLSDGANITTDNANDPTNSQYSMVRETYEESNNFTNSQNTLRSGQVGKWDFAMVDFSATENTVYCVRVVKSDSSLLDSYTVVPQFTTVPENAFILLSVSPFLFALIRRKKKRMSKINVLEKVS